MFSVLYNIVISPIELIVEFVFEFFFRLFGQRGTNQGFAIIGVSLAISLLTLPLYHRADVVQQKQRDLQKKLSHWVSHIKKTFKGDERFMMLQTYYRKNNYNPLSSLNGSISLLLQIPFFIAAYHFLSHLQVLNGAVFGPVSDLGKPDGLIKIGTLSINLLPILMTMFNYISSVVYLKGFSQKDKIQTYGMALIFLCLLYNSPSGLVLYWTCNNIFSLIKNIFYKLKNSRKVLNITCPCLGFLFAFSLCTSGILNSRKKYIAVAILSFCTFIPFIVSMTKKITESNFIVNEKKYNSSTSKTNIVFFILTGIFLTIMTGILIPSFVITASPAEFVDIQNYQNPLHFLIYSTCYAIGFFLLWAGIIRYMLDYRAKAIFEKLFFIVAICALFNYMCFGKKFGILTSSLQFANGLSITGSELFLNLLCIIFLICIVTYIFKFKKILIFSISVLCICVIILSGTNIIRTHKTLNDMSYIKTMENKSALKPLFSLSKTGKNVIVFMLDRAISGYVPYIFEERPELKEQFSGFTYYPNTLSHGTCTNFGSPALFGGYEYTVAEMNKRDTEFLADKHNEALLVLPVLFDKNDYEVTVCDPPYANYSWIPDLSIYDKYPRIKKYNTIGVIRNEDLLLEARGGYYSQNERNFFCYSIFKIMPLFIGELFYDKGNYFSSKKTSINKEFYENFSVLTLLANLTQITNIKKNTYLAIKNETTHYPCILQLPNYELVEDVDNSNYKTAADDHIVMDQEVRVAHFHAIVASFMALGKWFDFMKQEGIYNNTRIILVADHGYNMAQFDYMLMNNPEIDVELYNPLLMVKNFDSTEFTTSDEFMTNADVPTLATQGIIENPVNPFTGKQITNTEKTAHPQLVNSSWHQDVTKNNGKIFDTSDGHWYSVHDNIFIEENWKLVE